MIRFACPRCRTSFEAVDQRAGSKVNCPKCQQRMQIPLPPRDRTILAPLMEGPTAPPMTPPPVALPAPILATAAPASTPQQPFRATSPTPDLASLCPRCRQPVQVPPEWVGRVVRCPACRNNFLFSPGRSSAQVGARPILQPQNAPGVGLDQAGQRPFPKTLIQCLSWVWRISSPSTLALVLLLLFLPFVEVQCTAPGGTYGGRTLITQSGYQAAYGGYSVDPLIESAGRQAQHQMEWQIHPDDIPRLRAQQEQNKMQVSPAPLMILFPLLVGSAIVAGFCLPLGNARLTIMGSCVIAALMAFVAQVATGFPLEKAVADSVTRTSSNPGVNFGATTVAALLFKTSCTPWAWICLTLLICSGAILVAETIFTVGFRQRLERRSAEDEDPRGEMFSAAMRGG